MAAPAKESTKESQKASDEKSKSAPDEASPYAVNKPLFEEATKIKNRRELVEKRLAKMEEYREDVSDSVYLKVKTDYQTQLEEISQAFEEKSSLVENELEKLYQAKSEQERDLAQHQEVLEEAQFRHKLGEYTDKKFKEVQTRQNKEIKRFNGILDVIKGSIEQYEEILGRPYSPGSAKPKTEENYLEEMVQGVTGQEEAYPQTPVEPEHTPATGVPLGEDTAKGKGGGAFEGSLTDAKQIKETYTGFEDNLDQDLDSFLQTEGDYFGGQEAEAPDTSKAKKTKKKKKEAPKSETKAKTATPPPIDEDSISKILKDIPLEESTGGEEELPSQKEGAEPAKEFTGEMPEASLLLLEGELDDHEIILSENTSIGRSPSNDLVLKESKVSRQHATINFREGNYVMVDLKSSNGVLINDQKVEEAALKDGDEVRIGSFKFQFNIL